MKYRILGNTGMCVSELGFGTWGLGGNAYGLVDDDISIKSLRIAFDKGINFYDTSDLYGNGHSEEIISRAFKNDRHKVVLATKGGTLPHSGFYMPQDFSPQYLKNALENSLRRLKTDYIDLYQLHSPLLTHIPDAIDILQASKREGKIRAYGISVRSPYDGRSVIDKDYGFAAIQVNFNIIDHRALENGLFKAAMEKNIGIIIRTPLAFGYLTGSLTGAEEFRGIDHRANWPVSQRKRWANAPGLFSFLCEGKKRSPVQAALRFCLDEPGVSTVIPGMMTPDEVYENVSAIDVSPLTCEEHANVRQVYCDHIFYDTLAKQKEANE